VCPHCAHECKVDIPAGTVSGRFPGHIKNARSFWKVDVSPLSGYDRVRVQRVPIPPSLHVPRSVWKARPGTQSGRGSVRVPHKVPQTINDKPTYFN
jgi:hypothetical protein